MLGLKAVVKGKADWKPEMLKGRLTQPRGRHPESRTFRIQVWGAATQLCLLC